MNDLPATPNPNPFDRDADHLAWVPRAAFWALFLAMAALTASLFVGCASFGVAGADGQPPTEAQQIASDADLALLGVTAFVATGKTASEQAQRAAQVQEVAAAIKAAVTASGGAVLNFDTVAQAASQAVAASGRIPAIYKPLAQALAIKLVRIVSETQTVSPDIGARNARRLLAVAEAAASDAALLVPTAPAGT